MFPTIFSSVQRLGAASANDESNSIGAMDNTRSENLRNENTPNCKQLEGTALAVLMENRANAFECDENKLRRRLFVDVTNRQNGRYQKRNVPKNDPLQTSITDYAVVKHRPTTFEHLQKRIRVEGEECLKQTGLLTANTTRSSPHSASGTDIEDEVMPDSSSSPCSIQNDSDNEMRDLQSRFTQALGKRFSGAQKEHHENAHEPQIKRRKEEEARRLERETESNKKDDEKKNEAQKAEELVDYFCKLNYSLATVKKPTILTAGFACIEKYVLKELLDSMKPHEFIAKYALIDCRYPYEYRGGHIKGALNIYDPVVLENSFFPKCPKTLKIMIEKIPIFYCEYSSARGPLLASHLRKSDRVRNYDKYPYLYYNEIYVLQGGYNSFYNSDDECFKDLCEPTGYVPMHDKMFADEFKIYHMRNVRNGIGLETGMFQTAVIKKNPDIRRSHSVPQMPESPTTSQFASMQSSPEKKLPSNTDDTNTTVSIPMLTNPRTPTGRKK